MTYEEWLDQPPFQVPQMQKERRLCELLSELTEEHRNRCVPYGRFLNAMGAESGWNSLEDLPMLPVSVFKDMELKSVSDEDVFKVLTSSGTSGQRVSKVFLDQRTAENQQRTLYRILEDYIGKKRIPMLIVDSPEVLKNRAMFSARGAGILGFSIVSSRRKFVLDEQMRLDVEGTMEFLERYRGRPVLVFGFTYMIWEYFYRPLKEKKIALPLADGVMIHGGGWKKMQQQAVDAEAFREGIRSVCGIERNYDYYGMAEQTGTICMECEHGHLHASTYSDILIRRMEDFSVCGIGEEGLIQVLSPMASSYPGHSLLTEDRGILLGIDDCPCGRKGKYFRVSGRIRHSEVRGCSDTYEG